MADGAPQLPVDAPEVGQGEGAGAGAGVAVGGAGNELAGASTDEGSVDGEPRTAQELIPTVLRPDGRSTRFSTEDIILGACWEASNGTRTLPTVASFGCSLLRFQERVQPSAHLATRLHEDRRELGDAAPSASGSIRGRRQGRHHREQQSHRQRRSRHRVGHRGRYQEAHRQLSEAAAAGV